jgi:hypothetical protein
VPSKFYVRLLWASAQQAANKGNGIHGPSAGSRHSDDFEGGVIQDAVKHAPRERAMRSAALQSQGNFTSRRGVLLNHALPQRTAGLQLGVICVAAESTACPPLLRSLPNCCVRAMDERAISGCEQSQQRTTYSITSSARTKNDSGSVRPSAFAVLRLTASWYLDACSTGRSAGLVPLRILSI